MAAFCVCTFPTELAQDKGSPLANRSLRKIIPLVGCIKPKSIFMTCVMGKKQWVLYENMGQDHTVLPGQMLFPRKMCLMIIVSIGIHEQKAMTY